MQSTVRVTLRMTGHGEEYTVPVSSLGELENHFEKLFQVPKSEVEFFHGDEELKTS